MLVMVVTRVHPACLPEPRAPEVACPERTRGPLVCPLSPFSLPLFFLPLLHLANFTPRRLMLFHEVEHVL